MTVEERLQALVAEVEGRADWTIILARAPGSDDGPRAGAGIVVLDDATGAVMAAEVGIDDTGMASLSLRMFDGNMEPVEPRLVQVGDSVMFTSR